MNDEILFELDEFNYDLKISDKGLFDGNEFKFTSVILNEQKNNGIINNETHCLQ